VVDTWRFWIIHLWVEGFFELFATVMVAVIFSQLGLVSQLTAARVVYLDAILYLGGGIIGTGHHWYWTGQASITMALAATFSALEVVPLTLLTLDAWDFVTLTRAQCDVCGQAVAVPHKWTFYFLMAVGFWNFVGAGIFGFLINLPIVSYFEVGTILTPNHGHTAMMGVFGMLAIALLVFALRQVLTDAEWQRLARYVQCAFWGLNVGLALMVVTNLFPGGVLQLLDVLQHGYWHARSPAFLRTNVVQMIEWLRLPGGCHVYRSRRGPSRDRRGTDLSLGAQGIFITMMEQEDVEEDDTAFEMSLLIKPPAKPGVSEASATSAKGSSPRRTEHSAADHAPSGKHTSAGACTRLHTLSITQSSLERT
jgi:nitric oxide reductase subunit B